MALCSAGSWSKVAMSRAKGNLPRVIADEDFPKETLHSTLGIELTEHGDGFVKGQVAVTDRVKQELGLVHGGVYAAMAEGFCSMGTWLARAQDGMIVSGQQNDTSFLRPITEGTVRAHCRARHQGRTTWVWECEFTNDEGKLCALSRVTIAIRPPRPR
jgi:1,4-dihydroxy-2-naphthoyl-CoA hydrolase